MDLRQQAVLLDGETVRLTPMQYRLFALLVEHAGVVVSRPIILMRFRGIHLRFVNTRLTVASADCAKN